MKLLIIAATGALGRVVTRRALEAGHDVRVLVRSPEKLGALADRVHVVKGGLEDLDAIERAVAGVDAVISCAGPSRSDARLPDVFRRGITAVTEAMARHGVRRIVAINGGAAVLPGDERGLGMRLLHGVFRLLMGAMIDTNLAQIEALAASDRDWTAVRSPQMVDGPSRGPLRASEHDNAGGSVTREDLATFLLDALEDDTWVGKAPLVASP